MLSTSHLWQFDLDHLSQFPLITGVDEVGRGPLAGNVVAACVILDFTANPINGLNDSKKLSTRRRDELNQEIRERAVAFGIGECTPNEIDKHNILRASLLAMKRALENMGKQPGLLLVDGNQKIPDVVWAQKTVVKGDGLSASIAAASILAKVIRDSQMVELDALYPEYGFEKHKGYPTQKHRDAVNKFGLTPFHRLSFCGKATQQINLFS